METNTDNLNTEIYSDWYEVKSKIWDARRRLILTSTKLVEYKIKKINPLHSRAYPETCGALYSLFRSIGFPKYKKFLSVEDYNKIQEIVEKTIKGKQPSYEEIQIFINLTDIWLEESGMGKIDRDLDDPGNAVLIDRGQRK